HYMLDISSEAMSMPDGHLRFHAMNNKHEFKEYNPTDIIVMEKQMDRMIRLFNGFNANPL
ncbi:MAG TPA: hypothetical protein VIM77_01625, partial [Mucilaginibacter sp.]